MKHSFLPLLIGLLCWTGSQAATLTHAYDGSKTAAENGTDLQAAISGASSGTEIKVQAGTYVGNFTMKEGVNVSGGWNSTFDAQTDYATVLDANANGRVVEQPSNFTTLTIWSNLTIQNGKLTTASSVPANNLGSGVALGKKGQVKHCLIQNNTFNYNANCMGGGVGNDAVDAATDICAEDCWIRNNSGTHGGGARVRGTLLNCVIENNNTNNSVKKGPAGGVHLQGGRMVNCIVRGNTSGGDTGGARALNTSLIENCTIENNISLGKTGGVSLEGTSTLSNSIIKNNTSTTECGGVRSAAKSNIYNNLIYGNTAGTKQGGLLIESALPNVIGNTIVCNNQLTGTGSQAGVFITNTLEANGTFFVNNVVWGNMSNGTVESQGVYYISRYDKSTGQRSYNAIIGQKGDDSAETSIQLSADDPGFTDAAHGDFSLLPTSVLLDRGNSAKATVSKDLAGNDRIVNSSVDIGAYEYPVVASDVYVLEGEDLQSKINNTATGYTVYVQAGTYYGNFTMKDGVNVSGGWNADFTEQTDYATILDAQESGRVVNQPAAFSTLTIWSNLTIQNGKLTAALSGNLGAGVALNLKGQVKHCLIQNNTFTYSGNCIGGGVGEDAPPTSNTEVMVDDCWIRNNKGSHGGGVRIRGTIQNSIIEDNQTSGNSGGGVHLQAGRMVNCIVRGNTSSNDCGGVRLFGKCQMINTLVVDNIATGKVGGVGIESANSDIIGCTIVDNDQLVSDASHNTKCGISCGATSDNGTKLANNIVWGNKHNGVAQTGQVYYISHYNTANRSHNAIAHQNTTNGIKLSMSNDEDDAYIDSDENPQTGLAPHFADPANGDYRLTWQSPMFNKGNNALTTVTEDLDGDTRTKGGVVDYGCYEFDAVTVSISNSHAILTIRGQVCEESSIAMPKGYSGTANVVAEDGYTLTSVTLNGASVVIDNEGNFSVPAMNTDASIAITAKELTYYNRSVTEGRFGTICLGYAVPAGAITGAKVYKVLSFASDEKVGLLLEEVNTMTAGKPYFFLSEADEVSFGYIAEGAAAAAGDENGLYGTIAGETVEEGAGYYVLQNNLLCPVTAGDVTLAANRAYLKFSEVPDFDGAAPSPKRRVIAIQKTENTATGVYEITNSKSYKIIIDGQLMIIHDGKAYNVLGL